MACGGHRRSRFLGPAHRPDLPRSKCAAHLNSAGPREDLDEFLAAVQRIFDIEHAADKALRHTTTAMVADAVGVHELFLGAKLAEALEEASDRLAHSAQILKTYALEEVMRT